MRAVRGPTSVANALSLLALFMAVGGGTAIALTGQNTVRPDDIAPATERSLKLGPVPSGATLRGAVGGDFHAYDDSASDFGVDVTLAHKARNALTDDDVFVNVDGWQGSAGQTAPTTSDTNAGCDGTLDRPTAPPGDVCIYVSGADHAFNLSGYSVRFGTEGSRYGFKLKWDASQAGDTFVDGVWAYHAP